MFCCQFSVPSDTMSTYKGDSQDQSFKKKVEKHLITNNRSTFTLTVRKGIVHWMGDEVVVDLLRERGRTLTVHELSQIIVDQHEDGKKLKYSEECPQIFPKLSVKFKQPKKWTEKVARENLRKYFNCLGWGQGGWRQFKVPDQKPPFWPNGLCWKKFTASRATLIEANLVLQSLLAYYGYDVNTHHVTVEDGASSHDGEEPAQSAERAPPVGGHAGGEDAQLHEHEDEPPQHSEQQPAQLQPGSSASSGIITFPSNLRPAKRKSRDSDLETEATDTEPVYDDPDDEWADIEDDEEFDFNID